MKLKKSRTWFVIGLVLVMTCITAAGAGAVTLLDTGFVEFEATGEQFGQLFWNTVPSDWSAPKPFPGVSSATDRLKYQTFELDPGDRPYVQVIFEDPASAFFISAYGPAFAPVEAGPRYGLDVNYLGDAGWQGDFYGNPQFFQLYDPGLVPLVMVITEVYPGIGNEREFSLLVEGFYGRDYSEVPEPATLLLLGSGLCALICCRSRLMKG